MKKTLLALSSLLLSIGVNAQMNGSYTVGGTSPDFVTVGEACDTIMSQGVTGPVTINIRDGVYTDSIKLVNEIVGVSDVNTVTFQSESMDASAVEITNANYQAAYLDGEFVDYIFIDNLTLTTTASSPAIEIDGGVNDVTISNCVINGLVTTSTTSSLSTIHIEYSNSLMNDNILITNNTINNGSNGIYYYGDDLTSTITITNNQLNENYRNGMELRYYGTAIVKDNKIHSDGSVSYGDAIVLYTGMVNSIVERNEIVKLNQSGGAGFDLDYLSGSAMFTNNIVSMPGSSCDAVYVDYMAADVSFYNNTFRVGGDVFDGYYDVEFKIYNNILISTNGGDIYSIDYNNVTVAPETNNNAVFTTGDFAYLYWPYDSYYTLVEWQDQLGQGENSFYITDPLLAQAPSDLHACSDSLIGTGMYLPSVMIDIDGENRPDSVGSIGADYFNIDGSVFNGFDLETCDGVPLTLDAGEADSHLWSTGETTQTISASNFGEYSVEWTNSCGSYADTVVINDITPVADFSSIQSFFTFQFTNNSQNGTSYLWDFGDGSTSTEENPVHVYTSEDTYTVTLTVTNSCGTDEMTMTVTSSSVGLEYNDLSNGKINAYPNPTNGELMISFEDELDSAVEFVITDLNGAVVSKVSSDQKDTKLDLSALVKGIYIVSIQSNEFTAQKRIIKL